MWQIVFIYLFSFNTKTVAKYLLLELEDKEKPMVSQPAKTQGYRSMMNLELMPTKLLGVPRSENKNLVNLSYPLKGPTKRKWPSKYNQTYNKKQSKYNWNKSNSLGTKCRGWPKCKD